MSKTQITLNLTTRQLEALQDAIFEALDSDNYADEPEYAEELYGEMYEIVTQAVRKAHTPK